MHSIVPDTLQGALMVSVIDFFLSFLIISGIGFVLAAFPWLNRIAALLSRPAADPQAAPKPAASARQAGTTPSAGEVAAIGAAVNVMMDGAPSRVLSINPTPPRGWVAEGRLALLGSHNVSRKRS